MSKFYGVKIGRNPGIYTSWEECKKQISHFKGARYKSFETKEEAENYMNDEAKTFKNDSDMDLSTLKCYAFTDGSYNSAMRICGWGAMIIENFNDGAKLTTNLTGWCQMKEEDETRNITGELRAVIDTIDYCHNKNRNEITIFYDYQGIECWANGEWKTNKPITKTYKDYIDNARNQWLMTIHFVKVKGHSHIDGNEKADALAKMAVDEGVKTIEKILFDKSPK